jgi:hypothetical protein
VERDFGIRVGKAIGVSLAVATGVSVKLVGVTSTCPKDKGVLVGNRVGRGKGTISVDKELPFAQPVEMLRKKQKPNPKTIIRKRPIGAGLLKSERLDM